MLMTSSFLLVSLFLLISFNNICGFVFQKHFIFRSNNIIVRTSSSRMQMASTFYPSKTTTPNNNDDNDNFQIEPPKDINQLIHINDSNFDETISSSLDDDGLKLVLFSASWCGPCINMARTLTQCAQSSSIAAAAKFYQIDTDLNPESASIYSVRSIPCVLLFKDGRVVSEVVGSVPATVIEKQLAKYSQSCENDDESQYQ